jgi:sugar phosphate isomerase/epimerase
MINRRDFLQKAATLSLGGALLSSESIFETALLNKIGIQFFSLPKLLEKDLPGTLAMLSKMGYREAELYGPYTFSTAAANERWKAVTPSLGFSGSGFFGHTAGEMKSMLSDAGISVPSLHTDLDTLQNAMGSLSEGAKALGATYVILPAIPDDKRKTLDDYRKMADTFNRIGDAAQKSGVSFGYHNHGYGLKEMDGKIPLEVLLDSTDPKLVFLEMDLFWTTAGGADPVALLEKYKNRYKLMHVKDMSKLMRFSGDGGNSSQWIELFPYMTTAGNGVLDLKKILTKAKESGVNHFIVEQDIVSEPEVALKKSIDYLKTL